MRHVVLILGSVLLAGCTTMANGPMQRIVVESNPTGAIARFTRCGAMATKTLTTPGVGWVSRRSTQCRVIVSMPNYREQSVRLTRHVSRNMNHYNDGLDVVIGTSSYLRQFSHGKSIDEIIDLAADVLGYIRAQAPHIELRFSTEDSFRSEMAAAPDEAWRKQQ